jgi:hypothetical protein
MGFKSLESDEFVRILASSGARRLPLPRAKQHERKTNQSLNEGLADSSCYCGGC